MGPGDMDDGRKRAALALLGLRAADRRWLLARLPDDQRRGVATMLGELQRMKLPATPWQIADVADALAMSPEVEALEQTAHAEQRPAEVQRVPTPDPLRAALGRAEAGEVCRVLRDEPDEIVARVLALEDWPWAEGVLGLLGNARRSRIERLRREAAPPADAVAQALVEALVARLEAPRRGDIFAAELRVAEHDSLHNGKRRGWWFK